MIQRNVANMRIPFYKDGPNYKVAVDLLKKQKLTHVSDHTISSDFFDQYVINLEDLIIPQEIFDKYTETSDANYILKELRKINIKTYNQTIKELLKNQYVPSEIYKPIENKNNKKKQVLNKNNPFSEIDLSNKIFLYPNKNGKYKFLSAQMGYTLTAQDNILQLKPEYNIDLTNNLKTDLIIPDETIAEPIESTYGDSIIYYI